MPVQRHPIACVPKEDPFARFPLDVELIGRLRSSFTRVREHGDRMATVFYDRLFAAAPQLRTLFGPNLDVQARKLMDSLGAVIRNLEFPDENAFMLEELGRRHGTYGARPEHYELVTRLLVESMGEVLGPDADPRVLAEWEQALGLISRRMIDAQQRGRS